MILAIAEFINLAALAVIACLYFRAKSMGNYYEAQDAMKIARYAAISWFAVAGSFVSASLLVNWLVSVIQTMFIP